MKFSIRSWKTTIVGVLSGVLAIVAGSHHTSFSAALQDFQVQIGVIGMALGILSKDSNVSGPPPPETPSITVGTVGQPPADLKGK